jgi:sugar lactone lactonase YvrE
MNMQNKPNRDGKTLRVAAQCACALGENPLWHTDERRLYWCDIVRGQLFRLDPDTGATEMVRNGGGMIGGFTVEADGALLLFMNAGRIARWTPEKEETIVAGYPEMMDTRFNDVIADPAGRVFCGSMSTSSASGKLYRLNTDRSLTPVLANVGCSNGLAFSCDRRTLYHTDSFARTITRFDYDIASGEVDNPRIFARTIETEGLPDGLTVDVEDHVWSARWDGGAIVRYAPSGAKVQRINVPAPKTTSLAFGGDRLQTIYVTTAGGDARHTQGAQAGNLFSFEMGVCGVPEFRSNVCTSLKDTL